MVLPLTIYNDVTGRFGFPVKRVSLSCFEIPEVVVKDSVTEIAYMWNRGFRCVSSLAQQLDWTNFLKVWALIIVCFTPSAVYSIFHILCDFLMFLS